LLLLPEVFALIYDHNISGVYLCLFLNNRRKQTPKTYRIKNISLSNILNCQLVKDYVNIDLRNAIGRN